MLKKLTDIGFRKVAEWHMIDEKLRIHISIEDKTKQVLYCMVVDDVPMYIGKTTDTFKKTMDSYKKGNNSQKTRMRIHWKLKTVLANFSTAEVYTLEDKGLLHYGDFHINLSAGLEDSAIYEISPEWNIQGVNKSKSKAI